MTNRDIANTLMSAKADADLADDAAKLVGLEMGATEVRLSSIRASLGALRRLPHSPAVGRWIKYLEKLEGIALRDALDQHSWHLYRKMLVALVAHYEQHATTDLPPAAEIGLPTP